MGVSNVNNTNNIVKLALAKKAKGTQRTPQKPEWLMASGSIFNAPGANSSNGITDVNTRYSLDDMKRRPVGSRNANPAETSIFGTPKAPTPKKETETPDYDFSVSGGKEAIADTKDTQTKVEGITRSVETKQNTTTKVSTAAEETGETVAAKNKKFVKQYDREADEIRKENIRLEKLVKENIEHENAVDDAQNELNYLTLGGQPPSNKQGRVRELQQIIGARVGLMQGNGRMIYSLQRSQSRSLRKMSRLQTNYIKTQNTTNKKLEAQQKENNKTIEFAQEAEQWSALAQSGGQALALFGKLMVAAGSVGGFFGAALVAIGSVMEKVGTVVELVGQYGQTAASLTKGIAYAADGNLMAAMTSVSSAVQSGAACIKGTKEISSTFKQINAEAQAVNQSNAAKTVAKEKIKELTQGMSKDEAKEALGGMSKKEARKYMTEDLKKQMQDGKIATSFTYTNAKGKVKTKTLGYGDLKTEMTIGNNITKDYGLEKFKDGVGVDAALDRAKKAYTQAQNTAQNTLDIPSMTKDQNGKYVTNTLKKDGTTHKTVSEGKYGKTVKKAFKESIKKIGAKSSGIDIGSSISGLADSMSNVANVLASNSIMNSYTSTAKKKPVPPACMDARTMRIIAKNQKYRALRGYTV